MKSKDLSLNALFILICICTSFSLLAQVDYVYQSEHEDGAYDPMSIIYDEVGITLNLQHLDDLPTSNTFSPGDIYLPISTKSETAKVAYYQALEYASNVRFPEYFELMETAVKEDPNFFMGYAHMSLARLTFHQYEAADDLMDKALAIPANDFTKSELILRKLIAQLEKTPKSDSAELMEELTAAFPDNVQAHELASILASNISADQQSAFEYTRKMLKLRPDYPTGYNMLGYQYLAKDELAKAKEAFEKYILLAPKEANPYDSMADYYMKAGKFAKAAEHYSKAASLGMEGSIKRAKKALEMLAPFDVVVAKKEIEKSNKMFTWYVKNNNAKEVANIYTKDGKFMAPNGPSATGRKNVEAAMAGLIKSGNTNLDLQIVDLWGNESLVVEEGEYKLGTKDGKQVDNGKYIVVWKKEDGKWKMFRDIFNSDMAIAASH